MTHRILGYPNVVKTQAESLTESMTPGIVAQVVRPVGRYSARGLTASVASTVLSLTPPRGIYRVGAYAVASASGAGTLTLAAVWHDSQASNTANLFNVAGLSVGVGINNQIVIQVDSGSVTFSTTLGGTATYDLDVVLERLS